MPAPTLIGLTGRKRAGKDTVAARLGLHGFVRVAFADPLKATMYDLDPFVGPFKDPRTGIVYETLRLQRVVDMLGWDAAKALPEVRRLLQAHGVAMREHVGESVWVDAAMATVEGHLDAGRSVIVTDVRFPNEVDAIAARAGFHVHVTRPGLPTDEGDAHSSEALALALDEDPSAADAVVTNDGALEDLHPAADALARSL